MQCHIQKYAVTISDPEGRPIIAGWRKTEGARLWHISLANKEDPDPHIVPSKEADQAPLDAFSAYDLPSVESIVRYFHAVTGFPVRDKWLKAIEIIQG